jgi:DNA-binding PadR family transcriptional regulator
MAQRVLSCDMFRYIVNAAQIAHSPVADARREIKMHAHDHDREGARCGQGPRAYHARAGYDFRPPFTMMGHLHNFMGHGGGRARRGHVRTAILRLLTEAPMHGYQIIQELSARSEGAWSPSPGSVYPTLQLLADEGLVSAEESGGKKIFSLTDAGRAAAAELGDEPAPWEAAAHGNTDAADFRGAAAKLMQAMFQVGKGGSSKQLMAATEVINEARKKLYAILAED